MIFISITISVQTIISMGMSRLKIYRWGVMLLLISNLLILSWALFHHFRIERPPLHKNPLQLLGGLNLNEEVFQRIQSLGGEHHQQMNELNKREQDYIYKSLLTENEVFRGIGGSS